MNALGSIDDVILPGERLTREAFERLRHLIHIRDELVTKYQASVLAPITGSAKQCSGSNGIEPDGWFLKKAAFRVQATADLQLLKLMAILPGDLRELTLSFFIGSKVHDERRLFHNQPLEIEIEVPTGTMLTIEIHSHGAVKPSSRESSSDERELAFLPTSIQFLP